MTGAGITINLQSDAKSVAAAVVAWVDGKEIWWSLGTPAIKPPKGDAIGRVSVKWFCMECHFVSHR